MGGQGQAVAPDSRVHNGGYGKHGRRVAARSLAGFGVGQHSVRLGTGTRLAPGVYFVRLTQGAETVAGKVCVLE